MLERTKSVIKWRWIGAFWITFSTMSDKGEGLGLLMWQHQGGRCTVHHTTPKTFSKKVHIYDPAREIYVFSCAPICNIFMCRNKI